MRARAYWTVAPGRGEIREESIGEPGDGEVLVRALVSGVSRGTEALVHRGGVPDAVAETMRAPFQVGDFPGPVKYGYLSVGVVEQGPTELVGRRVFALHPHQDRYVVPADAVTTLPEALPTERAVLAGTAETAVNGVWEASPRFGDRVAVVGFGLVGAASALLLDRFPLERLEVVEVDPDRAALARDLGLDVVGPGTARGDCDVVVHTSASADGLATALALAGEDAEVVEMSWYGDRSPQVPLGEGFHARRLTLRASQVGVISTARRARRDHPHRMALALDALASDARFDRLLSEPVPFDRLPEVASGASEAAGALCPVVRY